MKKLLLFFVCAFLYSAANFSYAQISTTSMQDIIDSVKERINQLENVQDMEVVNVTIDLIVGGGEKYVYRYLDNSFDYKALVIGDRRIGKMNLVVRKQNDKDEKRIMVDKVKGKNILLDIFPDSRAFYEFTLSVGEYNEDNNAGHFAFLLYHLDPLKK